MAIRDTTPPMAPPTASTAGSGILVGFGSDFYSGSCLSSPCFSARILATFLVRVVYCSLVDRHTRWGACVVASWEMLVGKCSMPLATWLCLSTTRVPGHSFLQRGTIQSLPSNYAIGGESQRSHATKRIFCIEMERYKSIFRKNMFQNNTRRELGNT